jgi:regulator of sigma E protease
MPNFFINVLAFIVAISFLVAFHEWGHYCVARAMKVKVLRFSIGFGPVIWSKHRKNGEEFCISLIPLGGYVKMLDEREGLVADQDLPFAFNRQSVWKRIAIVAAGPLANFVLAAALFVVVLMNGIDGVAPIVISVSPDSPASQAKIQANDEIIAVQNKPTSTLMQISRELVKHLNEPEVQLTLVHQQKPYTVRLPLPSLQADSQTNILDTMGLNMGLPALVGKVQPGSPADLSNLQAGDRIVSVNQVEMPDWMDVVSTISEHPLEPVILGVERGSDLININITPEKNSAGRGYLGVFLDESLLRKEQFSFLAAIPQAGKQTVEYSWLTLKMIYFMISGQASLEHLSGPVSIAQVAGATAKVGFTHYLDFLAIISISLGVLNLLPIPVLDGGHLLYYLVEVLRRKPLSEAAQMIGLRFGLIFLVSLMLVALYNDILRLV